MRGQAGEEGTRPLIPKTARHGARRKKGSHPEAGHQQRMPWNGGLRAKNFRSEFFPMLDEGSQQIGPNPSIFTQRSFIVAKLTFQSDCRAVIQRMRKP